MIVGYRCAACGYLVDIATPWAWRCPNSSLTDRHHVLRLMGVHRRPALGSNPLLDGGANLAWLSFARAHGLTDSACEALADDVDQAVRSVDGVGFHVTPFGRADELSDAMGFTAAGGVYVKDDTGNVAGSQKARHLVSILLHLRVAEMVGIAPVRERPDLAIASCGNAAIAAATLAAAMEWPLRVFVPPSANAAVLARLESLGGIVVLCPRRPEDPPGDPCILRFREAVEQGAIPFSVQGPENALCLDVGRSMAWEIAAQSADTPLDRIFIQVGGGAFATCVGDGFRGGPTPRLTVVQAEACAPFDRAWRTAQKLGLDDIGFDWAACMQPWPSSDKSGEGPQSLATGILDDETYDWIGIIDGLARSNGDSVVVSEAHLAEANRLALTHTAVRVDPTGSAGLAGLVAQRASVGSNERVGVILSGVIRR
jgi:threonine synthase